MSGFASLGAGAGHAAGAAWSVLGEGRLDADTAQVRELDRFLAGVERSAFRIAQCALHDTDDAHDVVQVAMLRLAQSYGSRPTAEWKPLFYRILYNGIRDLQRRHRVRRRFFGLLPGAARQDEDGGEDLLERVADSTPGPLQQLATDEAMRHLDGALRRLPARQLEAFSLRCLEGLDVAATAAAMDCSEGSVKTHYFRALQTLRAELAEVGT
jgi:RNA polymerase sigma-70 factor (ECF subfamily)